MKIITTLIIFIVGILQSCTFFDPSIQAPIGKPQTFVLEFSEAMDTQTALDSSNYTVISSLGDTIKSNYPSSKIRDLRNKGIKIETVPQEGKNYDIYRLAE